MNSEAQTISAPRSLAQPFWLWLSAACSLVYFITKSWQPYPGSIALKALSIAPLAWLAFQHLPAPERWWLGTALSFATLGDILLDLPGNYFVQGLAAFLVTQLLYAGLFARHWQRPLRLPALGIVVLLFSLTLTIWMLPGLGKLTIPVLCYIGALTLMAESAILANFKQRWIVWGAILFLLSDSLIGVNRFKLALPLRDYLVWATYYFGQCGITLGYLREKGQEPL
jgi:uncharacterized membrane protein YhhN